jgi:hypothetical protein
MFLKLHKTDSFGRWGKKEVMIFLLLSQVDCVLYFMLIKIYPKKIVSWETVPADFPG